MTINNEQPEDQTPFTDLLFCLLVGFVGLFAIAFLNMQPQLKKAEIHSQAEFIVTVTWPLDNKDDVDTWMEDPLGNLVFFRNKERGLMHLDRDDLGNVNDVVYLQDGTQIKYPYNQELLTIRGFVPGEWILNVHMYSKREEVPTEVTVSIDKLNPTVKRFISKKITLSEKWEEATVTRFTMTASGDVINIDDMPKKLITVGGMS